MRVPLSWLKEYVDVVLPLDEIARKLTQAGLEVGNIESVGGSWDKVTVGLVLDVQPHPNADRLRLVTVDLGDRRQTVVCGAPNVANGQKVAFASVGARLIDGHDGKPATLKPAKIRGIVSEGMVCSEKELGLSESHEGILVLPADAPVGQPLSDYMGETVLVVEVTPNRPDWLSVLGVAREVAALSGQAVRSPSLDYAEGEDNATARAKVEIKDPDLCRRYCASVIEGVRIGPSPRWMQKRLESCGMRPINNVVDVTNYVMLEYGQPLHAFDYDYLADKHIIVRRAAGGEGITSLDGVRRELSPAMLVIADAQKAVAVAGVMGGANSEVSDQTTRVLLESANFNQASIRKTSAALNLRSEASIRFERGLSPELAEHALRRATRLIIETAGGKAARGYLDVFPGKTAPAPIELHNSELKRLLGMSLPVEQTQRILDSLGFACEKASPELLDVKVPFWRSDVRQSADLVEEVARIVGYDHIPTTLMCAEIPQYQPSRPVVFKDRLKSVLTASGLQEVINYSLTSVDSLRRTTVDGNLPGPAPVMIANPMSRDFECLRTSLRPRILSNVAANQRYEDRIRLFEVGRVFMKRENDLPQEVETLGIMLAGNIGPLSWRTKETAVDFFDAKGIAEAIFGRFQITARFKESSDDSMRPGRCADILSDSVKVGVIGEMHPRVLENFRATGPVYLVEMDLEKLLAATSSEFKYEPLARFPSIVHDFALVMDARVAYQDIAEVVKSYPLVVDVSLFDVYQGGQIAGGKKSLALRVTFQSPDHTLTDEEVNAVQKKLLEALGGKFGVTLRG